MKVAFQGEHGAYSEQAILEKFGKIETVPCKHFRDIFDAVERGEVDYGMVPIMNSTAGSINQTYDLLLERDLPIVGEHYFRVVHCLIGKGSLNEVQQVQSHPQALAQCEEFLEKHDYEQVAVNDTAGSVRALSLLAALCPRTCTTSLSSRKVLRRLRTTPPASW